MALYTKVIQGDGTWRLLDASGNVVGRVWATAHADRVLRDGSLAESIAAIIGQAAATRRTNARTALSTWTTAGGRSVDFSALTRSLNNDAGQPDGNTHLYIAGNEIGYLHGVETARDLRLSRIVRLAEECAAGEALGTSTLRNNALNATIDRFSADGALS